MPSQTLHNKIIQFMCISCPYHAPSLSDIHSEFLCIMTPRLLKVFLQQNNHYTMLIVTTVHV